MALNNPAPVLYQNIRERMDKRKPTKKPSMGGLLGPTKNMMRKEEEMSISEPSNRAMAYMDMIIAQREGLKSND